MELLADHEINYIYENSPFLRKPYLLQCFRELNGGDYRMCSLYAEEEKTLTIGVKMSHTLTFDEEDRMFDAEPDEFLFYRVFKE